VVELEREVLNQYKKIDSEIKSSQEHYEVETVDCSSTSGITLKCSLFEHDGEFPPIFVILPPSYLSSPSAATSTGSSTNNISGASSATYCFNQLAAKSTILQEYRTVFEKKLLSFSDSLRLTDILDKYKAACLSA
jgi:hypothetical protein